MRDAGYTVIAPIMPWAQMRGYEGTREQGHEIIDEAVKALAKDKVVVVGHSMGAMAILEYGTRNIPSTIKGLISVAAGHDPNNARKLRTLTENEAGAACAQMKEGNGSNRNSYPEMNNGKKYSIEATAAYYCTYYSVNEYPDSLQVATDIKIPTFILSGEGDRLTHIYSHQEIFDSIPSNSNNRYQVLPGKHKSVLFKNTNAILKWIEEL